MVASVDAPSPDGSAICVARGVRSAEHRATRAAALVRKGRCFAAHVDLRGAFVSGQDDAMSLMRRPVHGLLATVAAGSAAVALALAGCGASSGGAASPLADGGVPGADGGVPSDGATPIPEGGTPVSNAPADSGLAWANNPDGGCALATPFVGMGSPTAVGSVSATIVDLTGAPVPGEMAIVCGRDLCSSPGTTSASGAVTVGSGAMTMMTPMFRYGDAFAWTQFLVPVTAATTSLGTLVTAPLPSAGMPWMPGADVSSGEMTLSVPAGGSVVVDTLTYDTPDKQRFRAVPIPIEKETAIPGIASNQLLMLFGVGPAGTLFCPPAAVSVPNTLGWPAGTPVEFLILGDDPLQRWAPYGDWTVISDGTVGPDGTTIVTSPGEGFPVLSVFGVRPKC
jgi:hypothetical protein